MEIRGDRECKRCGTRWSYYDTGSVACPDCGSVHSVGIEPERTLHTDAPVEFDLTPVRSLVGEVPRAELTEELAETAREYVRKRGFVNAGELRPLDDTYLAATEAVHVADVVGRAMTLSEAEEWYFLEVLRGADRGDRPDPDDVPSSLRDARGLAYATAVREYRRDLSQWLDATDAVPGEEFARTPVETLGDHTKRIQALQGDVPPETAETLIEATRALSAYLRAEDPDGLDACRDRLQELSEFGAP